MFRRKINGQCVEDSHAIENIEYNAYAGAQKNLEVGPALRFVSVTTSEVKICAGDQLFLFKTTSGLGWVELSESAGIGVVGTTPSANTFPVFGQEYTRISAADYKYIKGAADIFLYVLKDDNQERVAP
jgi:hypothetical protein